jgi:hypothetical protein
MYLEANRSRKSRLSSNPFWMPRAPQRFLRRQMQALQYARAIAAFQS